ATHESRLDYNAFDSRETFLGDRLEVSKDQLFAPVADGEELEKSLEGSVNLELMEEDLDRASLVSDFQQPLDLSGPLAYAAEPRMSAARDYKSELGTRSFNMPMGTTAGSRFRRLKEKYDGYFGEEVSRRGWYARSDQDPSWLIRVFPDLPPVSPQPEPFHFDWPDQARQLADSLLRTEALAGLAGGLVIDREVESFDARWAQTTARNKTLAFISPGIWLVRSEGDRSQTLVHWCDDGQRGVWSVEFGLGRVRESVPRDLAEPPLGLDGYVQQSLEQSYRSWRTRVESAGDERAELILTEPANGRDEVVMLIDTKRHVILSIERRYDGKATSTTRMSDFVQAAGAWWATRVEIFDAESRRIASTTLKFAELDPVRFRQRIDRQLQGRDRVQLLKEPLPILPDAKQAAADDKAVFEDRIVLAMHAAAIQNWDRVTEQLNQAIQLADGKAGLRWVRYDLLLQSRQREQLKLELMAEAKKLAHADDGALVLAEHIVGRASGAFEANEMLTLLDVLQPVYDRQPEYLQAAKSAETQRANYLEQTGARDRALELRHRLAEAYPHDVYIQQQYARSLASAGEYQAAYAWLDAAARPDARWLPYEQQTLRSTYTELLWQQGGYAELAVKLASWTEENPTDQNLYGQYLSALIRTDDEDRADELVSRWMTEARQPAPLDPAVAARLDAAVALALGNGYNVYTQRIEERWLPILAETAEFFAVHPSHAYVADRIMNDWRFRSTDACRDVRRRITRMLVDQIETLPAVRLGTLVGWIMSNDPAVETPQWKKIAAGLEKRWATETQAGTRNQLAS
ncbi:MAG: hypothetical protein JJ992_17565, partial [Planctomycetes bacterium]|nr:hypothetical protein [Planctomycetota bacterium]